MKESRKGKFGVKGDEGIFLGYSCRSKTYKCLNLSTHKIIESVHVRIDEFAEKSEEESNKEPNDYKRFVYYEPDTLQNLSERNEASPLESPKSQKATELQPMQPESQSEGPKLQSEATELVLEQTESNGPKSQIVGPKLDVEDQEEFSTCASKIFQKASCT